MPFPAALGGIATAVTTALPMLSSLGGSGAADKGQPGAKLPEGGPADILKNLGGAALGATPAGGLIGSILSAIKKD